jgi:hypothetical protein
MKIMIILRLFFCCCPFRDNKNYITTFEVTFDDYQVPVTHTILTYELMQFIADVGGLLGLFMGCSLLSIVEVLFDGIEWCVKKIMDARRG